MTVVNLFRRYKRWNPVHPTYGAFWGVGMGLGCGVGWGPGFGPEVVGYVGSGCGLGLSIGVTFLGIGIGLPASGLTCIPCDLVAGAGEKVLGLTSTWIAPVMVGLASQAWESVCHQTLVLNKNMHVGGGWHSKAHELPSLSKWILHPIIDRLSENDSFEGDNPDHSGFHKNDPSFQKLHARKKQMSTDGLRNLDSFNKQLHVKSSSIVAPALHNEPNPKPSNQS
ncbi:unnamed protein product [Sphagnum troendelagicum]|uniref:Uncharacterized protein n=1 Tax=Sphagnum troendelagicum TaxID=128251 RepID=A0ABP0UTH5_9BRYO